MSTSRPVTATVGELQRQWGRQFFVRTKFRFASPKKFFSDFDHFFFISGLCNPSAEKKRSSYTTFEMFQRSENLQREVCTCDYRVRV